MSNYYIVHLKLIRCCTSIITIKLEKILRKTSDKNNQENKFKLNIKKVNTDQLDIEKTKNDYFE